MIHLPRHALMNDIAYLWYVHLFTLSVLSEKTLVIYELKKGEKIRCMIFSARYIPTTYVPTLNLKFKTWGRLNYTFPCLSKKWKRKIRKKSWFLHKIIFVSALETDLTTTVVSFSVCWTLVLLFLKVNKATVNIQIKIQGLSNEIFTFVTWQSHLNLFFSDKCLGRGSWKKGIFNIHFSHLHVVNLAF